MADPHTQGKLIFADALAVDESLSRRFGSVFVGGGLQRFFWREFTGTDQGQPVAEGGTEERRSWTHRIRTYTFGHGGTHRREVASATAGFDHRRTKDRPVRRAFGLARLVYGLHNDAKDQIVIRAGPLGNRQGVNPGGTLPECRCLDRG